ncbi:MAG: GTPase ObgE [Bacteroidota bacterium]
MEGSNFIDYVKICCRSGKGGGGASHFRREKHVPLGGPDGGNGGRGGHIILRGNTHKWTLLHLKYTKHVIAEPGKRGEAGCRTGAEGKDMYLDVPLGTIARDAETDEVKAEILYDGQEIILTPGGRGGLGNEHFKTPTNQAPHTAQPGEEGLEEWVVLELKILADVGLVGFPNAGKSTLLSVVSAAKPKIADYPFTTLTPNLGVVAYRDFRSFVIADIPGIIEGAAEGRGIGLRFLRHIERNSALLFMIPADSLDYAADYNILLSELQQYNPELLHKSRLVAITKTDLVFEEELAENIEKMKAETGLKTVTSFSAVTGEGIGTLKDLIWKMLQEEPAI